jgi:hypothetical protein
MKYVQASDMGVEMFSMRGHLVLFCLFNYVNIADGPVLGFAWAIMFFLT